jgi:hypothetical protein
MPRGGKRDGAGRKPGQRALDKIMAREELRRMVIGRIGQLVEAQIANALGIKYLVVRQKGTGKFLRVPKGAAEKLSREEEIIEVWEKDPSIHAFTDLMNRAIGKPIDQVDMQVSGELSTVEARLLAGRKRVAEKKEAQEWRSSFQSDYSASPSTRNFEPS